MTTLRTALFAFVAVAAVGSSACLPGPETLAERLDVVVTIVGLRAGDAVELRVDDRVVRPAVDGPRTAARLELEPGRYDAAVRVSRDGLALCADFPLDVDDAGAAALVDVDDARACDVDAGPAQLQRLFASARLESERNNCTPGPDDDCLDSVTVLADGTAEIVSDRDVERGAVDDDLLLELADAFTSGEADAFFDAGCPSNPPLEFVTRTLLLVTDEPLPTTLAQRVELSGCGDGFVGRVRSLFARVRLVDE